MATLAIFNPVKKQFLMTVFNAAVLFCLTAGATALGQTTNSYIPKIVPPSPQAATLTRYVDIPVSYYTGTADISIPVYTIQEGKLSLPVSISYHPSGIKVADEAGQVGLGWALNAGGVVARTVMGEDDFSLGRYFSNQDNLPANTFPKTQMQMGAKVTGDPSKFSFDFYAQQGGGSTSLQLKAEDGMANEYEPDIYNFNFAGYSGKFIISRTREIIMNEKSDIQIRMIESGNPVTVSWEIKTPDGTAYLFNERETFRSPGGAASVSSWYLSQITSPEGAQITLSYNTIVDAKNYPQGAITETMGVGTIGDVCISGGSPVYSASHTIERMPARYMSTVYLNEITFQNGSVRFVFESREDLPYDKKLKTIEIYSKAGGVKTLLKAYDFSYSYFDGSADADVAATGDGSVSKRLKLLSLTEKSAGGSTLPPHTFTYFEGGNYDLPAKTSFAQDHWGYFNGKLSNQSLIPTFTAFSGMDATKSLFGKMTGTERDAGPDYSKAFSLKRITYPTGGYTEFDYEAHDYDVNKSDLNDYSYAGGLGTTLAEKVVPFLYNNGQKDVPQDFEFDLSRAATGPGGLTTNLKLEAFVRFNDVTECNILSGQTRKVFFELIEKASGLSIGVYDMLAMQECTDNVNGLPSPCINKGCYSLNGKSVSGGFKHTNTFFDIMPGKYIWRATAGDGTGFGLGNFTVKLSWYEPAEQTPGAMKTGGGLRVKSITANDGVKSNIRTFTYRLTETSTDGQSITKSSGRLMTKPQYTYAEDRVCVQSNGGANYDYKYYRPVFRTSNSVIPLSTSASGSVVGYDQVTVAYGANGEYGQSVFYYDNQSDVVNNFGYFRPPLLSSKPFKSNGNLLRQEDFVKSGTGLVKVKELENEYYLSTPVYQYAAELRSISEPFAGGAIVTLKKHGFFYPAMIKNWNYLKSEKTRVYDQGSASAFVETRKEYFYTNTIYTQLSQIRTSDSRGRNVVTDYKYPFDFSSGVYPAMVTRNMVSPVIEETTSLENGAVLNWINTEYSNPGSGLYLPKKVQRKIGQGAAFTVAEFLTYDGRGNLLTYKEKDGATTKLEYYGTNDEGKIDLLKSKTDADGTTASSRTSYNYKPLVGIQSVRGPSGKVTWYNYDVFGRLSDIREDTSTGNLIKSFHYNYAGQGGWSNGIVDDPGVDTLSTLGLISVAGCNFNIALSASPANPNTGQSVTLTAACAGTDCNNLTYSWTGQGVTGTASTTTFGAPAAAGSYNYSVSVARTGCSTPKIASLPLPVGPTGEACYVLAPASYPDRRLSNHNGLLKVKAQDGTASQIWELSSQGTGFSKIISKGSTNGAGIGSVLGVASQGNAEGNPVELQTSATGDHQLWEISAMTGSDQGRDKFVRKGTTLRIGSRFNWGAGSDNLDDPASDLALANDPNNDFGGNKWIKTSVGCPTGPCTPPAKPVISLATGSGSTVCAATNQKVTLKTNGSGTIKWYKDGVLIAGAAGTTYEVTVAGSYTTTTTSTGTPTCTSTVSDAYNVLQTTGCALSGDDRCIVTQVWLLWRDADHQRLKKATIQGSDDGVNWTTVHTFDANATAGWNIAPIASPRKFQHIRYAANPTDGVGDLKEIRFYHDNSILTGTGFGSEPNINGLGWANALDGNEANAWHAAYNTEGAHPGNTNFVGLTLPCATTCIKPTIYKTTAGNLVCPGSKSATLIASGFTGSLRWYKDGVLISGQTEKTLITSGAGAYKALSTNGTCTSGVSNEIVLQQDPGCMPSGDDRCIVTRVQLLWRDADHQRLKKATIQGSDDGVNWTTVHTFEANATVGWNIAPIASPRKFQHIRYAANPTDGVGDLKEIRFYHDDYILTGIGFGSEPNISGLGWANALDGNEGNAWHAAYNTQGAHPGNTNFVGLTLPCATTCVKPTIYKTGGSEVCAASNKTVTLIASGCTADVSWFRDGVSTGTGLTHTTSSPGTYTAKCSSGGRISEASPAISVAQSSDCGGTTCIPPGKPTISLSGSNTTVCFAKSQRVTLSTNATGTIQWYKEGVAISSATGSTYEATVAGNYTVTSTVNCMSPASNVFAVPQAGCAEGCNQTVTVNILHCIDAEVSENAPGMNYGSISEFALSTSGTIQSSKTTRAFINSEEFQNIPQGAIITSATLDLYGIDAAGAIHTSGNTGLAWGGSPAPFLIQRVTGAWQELQVNWGNQPLTSPDNQVECAAPSTQWNYNTTENVTQLIQDMINQPKASRYGLALRLLSELPGRSVVFASTDAIPGRRPKLTITYKTCP
ncbi:DNRLRE domain-containing protein [Siphonobacter aquaeclarae]|uniref:YD repeat-containing protein n=1 Tax=Siphonobacter aquaeclarae TaxID=563176 RepID=A0A1G9T7S9_9BACT|nr:DNRLRE domain-containing protein [Siphonobacter aquaeclarae]SDM43708.1 YD repeat-containing protein [Siphonobacter aquaeclarae]